MLAGIILYLFRGSITTNIRYLLQVPPLGVAAYIFAFNLFRYYKAACQIDLRSQPKRLYLVL